MLQRVCQDRQGTVRVAKRKVLFVLIPITPNRNLNTPKVTFYSRSISSNIKTTN